MEKIILLTIPGCQPIIGTIINEDKEFYNIEYPVILFKEDTYIYTIPYAYFAKDGKVTFNKNNVISVSDVDDEIQDFYKSVVLELRTNKVSFKKPTETKKEISFKLKHLH